MEERELRQLFARLFRELKTQKELLMALHPQVQALHDALAAQGTALSGALAELVSAESKVVTLTTTVADLTAKLNSGQPIDAEDLQELANMTTGVSASVDTIKAAMPAPISPATVQAASDAAQVPPAA